MTPDQNDSLAAQLRKQTSMILKIITLRRFGALWVVGTVGETLGVLARTAGKLVRRLALQVSKPFERIFEPTKSDISFLSAWHTPLHAFPYMPTNSVHPLLGICARLRVSTGVGFTANSGTLPRFAHTARTEGV